MTNYNEETLNVRGRKTRLYRGGARATVWCFFMIHFAHGGCRFTSSLRRIMKCCCRSNPALPVPRIASINSRSWKIWSFIISIFARRFVSIIPCSWGHRSAVGSPLNGRSATAIRLKSLVLIDPLGLRLDEAPAADVFGLDPAALRRAVFADPAGALAMEILPETPKADAIVSTILARRTLARFAWQFPDNPRLRRYLDRVKLPTMILWGEHDGVVPAAHGKAYREGIAGAKLATVAGSGHLPHIEAPAVCADIIRNFLRTP